MTFWWCNNRSMWLLSSPPFICNGRHYDLVLIRFISPAQYIRTCVIESIIGQKFSMAKIPFISIYSRGKMLSPFFKACSLLFLKSLLVYSGRICFNFYIDKIKKKNVLVFLSNWYNWQIWTYIFIVLIFTSNCSWMKACFTGIFSVRLATESAKLDTFWGSIPALNSSFKVKEIAMYCSWKQWEKNWVVTFPNLF